MFGYSDRQIARARRRSPLWRVGLELLLLLLVLLGTGAGWLFATPDGLRLVVTRLVGDAPVTLTFADAAVLPSSRLMEPRTWRLAVSDIAVVPHDASRPRIRIGQIQLGLPELARAWYTRELVFDRVRLSGLDIQATQQRPPPPWTPKESALSSITVEHLEVWDARFAAPEDPPLGEARVEGIYGELWDVVYEPGPRLIHGRGELRARAFRSGAIDLEDVRIEEVVADASDLTLAEGTFSFAGASGQISGTIRDLHRRPAVELHILLHEARMERVFGATTGGESPLQGQLDLDVTVHSGGEIPRGGAWMEGRAQVVDGRIPLGDGVSRLVKDLVRLAPFLELDDQDRVVLGRMTGDIRLDRGSVDIPDMIYEAPRRTLQVRGHLDGTTSEVVIRAVPATDPETRAGAGIVIAGTADELRLRIARKEELLPSLAEDGAPERRQRKGIRLLRRKKDR